MSGCRATSVASGVQDVRGGQADVHVLLLAADQHAEELAAVLGADERRVQRHAGRLQMARRQRSGGHRDDRRRACRAAASPAPTAPGSARWSPPARAHAPPVPRWNSDRKPQLVVIASAPSRHQFRGGGQEIVQQAGGAVQHHALRRWRPAPRGTAPGTARSWRCPCRRGCGGTSPPASGCPAARRRSPCRLCAMVLHALQHCRNRRREMPASTGETPWPTGRSPRLTSTCWRSGTRRPSATAWRSSSPERRALRLHRRADGLHRPEGQADRRPRARRHDPLHRTAARQGDRPGGLVRLCRTPPISRPSR